MAVQEFASGTLSALSSTETSMPSSPPRTDDGIFQLLVDTADMIEDDVLVLRIKEKARSGDTQRTLWVPGVQQQAGDTPIVALPALMLLHGWDFTAQATAGTIDLPWSIRQVSTGVSEHESGSQTATISTEHTIGTADQTTEGIFQLFVDTSAMTITDRVRIRLREKVVSGGTKRNTWEWWIPFSSLTDLWASPALILLHGWDFTLTQTDGTGRAFPWSIRKAA